MELPGGLRPTKIFAVHLNFPSRAAQRGRTPSDPSYFLKPPSSLGADGAPVKRPQGCELLAFEGELAVVVGARTHRVSPEQAAERIGWFGVANDFGAYDFKSADRGSNVLSKGADGFTPLGSSFAPAAGFDLRGRQIRTLVNGEVAQEDDLGTMLFSPARLVADLSRLITLEPGDLILAGTPAGSRPVEPGDDVVVEIEGIGSVHSPVLEDEAVLPGHGAMPNAGAAERAAAWGADVPPGPLSPEAEQLLREVSTATLTVQLRRRGVLDTFIRGIRPTRPDLRLLGTAKTLRYVPLREDVLARDGAELNAQKRAVETIGPGEVLVIEARGELNAGTIGDILALRALRRGATGIVTDGGLRDGPAVGALDIPTYYAAPHAAVLGLRHYPLAVDEPIACGGVLVMPGDVLVGDGDGVVVVPAALAEEVAHAAAEQEIRERWSLERVEAGESVRGVYPIGQDREAEFEAWRGQREVEQPGKGVDG